MKILHLNEHIDARGGIETYLLSLIPRLVQAGLSQSVAYAGGQSEGLPAALHRVPELSDSSRSAESRGFDAMQAILSSESPDVVHLHNIHNLGSIRACLDSVPTVLTCHDYRYICPASNFYFRRTEEVCERVCGPGCFTTTLRKHCMTPRPRHAMRYYRRVRWIARRRHRFARLVAPSGAARDRFVRSGFSSDRVTVLPYFCRMEPLDEPRTPPEQPTLTYIGRVSPNKGCQYFLRALARLPENVHGMMVGSFSEESAGDIRSQAAAMKCEHRLEMNSWAEGAAIRDILNRTSILIFPSIWAETLGIVGLEAMATGVPVVASRIGGVTEWLQDSETGYLVPPKDEAAIASAAQRILDSPQMALRMGKRGLESVRDKFSPARHVEQLIAVYRQAAGLSGNVSGSCIETGSAASAASGASERRGTVS